MTLEAAIWTQSMIADSSQRFHQEDKRALTVVLLRWW
jgi:hypothetical protein